MVDRVRSLERSEAQVLIQVPAVDNLAFLPDKALQAKLITNGRCPAESKDDWQVILKDWDNVVRQFV